MSYELLYSYTYMDAVVCVTNPYSSLLMASDIRMLLDAGTLEESQDAKVMLSMT